MDEKHLDDNSRKNRANTTEDIKKTSSEQRRNELMYEKWIYNLQTSDYQQKKQLTSKNYKTMQ